MNWQRWGKQVKVIAALILIYFLVPAVYAQNEHNESLTITTYYPSPYGQYRSLKLNPSNQPESRMVAEGVMYYNKTDNVIRYYNNTAWVNLTGGGGGGSWTVLTRTCPWGSDATAGSSGWGDQCNLATSNCCVLPACPSGWTDAGTEVKLSGVACPKTDNSAVGRACEWNDGGVNWYHPVAVGNVVRKCMKRGATVVKLTSPWKSDFTTKTAGFKGWGDQCFSPFANCNSPAVPTCPAGWTNIGTDVEAQAVSCPKTRDLDANKGCFWDSATSINHPVAVGSVVTICERN